MLPCVLCVLSLRLLVWCILVREVFAHVWLIVLFLSVSARRLSIIWRTRYVHWWKNHTNQGFYPLPCFPSLFLLSMSDLLNKEECLEADEFCFLFFYSLISELITPSSRISSCGWEYVVVSVMFCLLLYLHVAWLGRLQDLNNFESDPEEFARTLCKDLGVEDPEVGVRR